MGKHNSRVIYTFVPNKSFGSLSDIQDYFEYILKKHGEDIDHQYGYM